MVFGHIITQKCKIYNILCENCNLFCVHILLKYVGQNVGVRSPNMNF